MATSLHGADVVRFAGWLHDHYVVYLGFMKLVSKHIVEAYLLHRALIECIERREADSNTEADRGVHYVPLSYPTVRLKPERLCPVLALTILLPSDLVCTIQAFFANFEVTPADGHDKRAITWHEL